MMKPTKQEFNFNKMTNILTTNILIITIFLAFTAVYSNDGDYFCKVDPTNAYGDLGNYQICRKCPSLEDDCETSDNCQCDNIEIRKPGKNS